MFKASFQSWTGIAKIASDPNIFADGRGNPVAKFKAQTTRVIPGENGRQQIKTATWPSIIFGRQAELFESLYPRLGDEFLLSAWVDLFCGKAHDGTPVEYNQLHVRRVGQKIEFPERTGEPISSFVAMGKVGNNPILRKVGDTHWVRVPFSIDKTWTDSGGRRQVRPIVFDLVANGSHAEAFTEMVRSGDHVHVTGDLDLGTPLRSRTSGGPQRLVPEIYCHGFINLSLANIGRVDKAQLPVLLP